MLRAFYLTLTLAAAFALASAGTATACDSMKNASATKTASSSSSEQSYQETADASDCQGADCAQSSDESAERTVAATD